MFGFFWNFYSLDENDWVCNGITSNNKSKNLNLNKNWIIQNVTTASKEN